MIRRLARKALIAAAVSFLSLCCSPVHAQGPLTITSISPTSGPVGSTVTITGLNFGTSQAGSSVTLNGTAAVVVAWSDTSITAVVPSGASSGPFSVTVDNETTESSAFTITALPSSWSDTDIGSVGLSGTASYANGTFSVKGAGSWFYSETSDAIHFAYQSLSGNGTIVARVVSVTNGSTMAGVMIRETLNANATSSEKKVRRLGLCQRCTGFFEPARTVRA